MTKTTAFKLHLFLLNAISLVQSEPGLSPAFAESTACSSETANIKYNMTTGDGESIYGILVYYFGSAKIADRNGSTLNPEPNYSTRLKALGTYDISLSNVSTADAGEYRCNYITKPNGRSYTATATLSVQVSPVKACSVTANQTDNILTCLVITESGHCGSPVISANWLNFTGTSIAFDCTVRRSYRCCATSAALTNCYSGSPDDFCVKYSCMYGPDADSFTFSPNLTSYELEEESSFTVNCSADCFPVCEYSWTGPGGRYAGNDGTLLISPVKRYQSGVFICTAKNPNKPDSIVSANISIAVKYGPDISSINLSPSTRSYEREENASLNVNCSADCYPSCLYSWTGPGGSYTDNTAILSIPQITRANAGVWKCTATNPIISRKSVSVTIYVTVLPKQNGFMDQDGSPVIIGASTGSALVLVILLGIGGFIFYKRRQSKKSSEEGLVVNTTPDPSHKGCSAGVEYAEVVKVKKNNDQVYDTSKLYSPVEKTRTDGRTGDREGGMHAYSGVLQTEGIVGQHPSEGASKGSMARQGGLIYVDLVLNSPSIENEKPVIRGLENMTEYAHIAFGKRGEPLPDGDEEHRE